MGLMGLILLPTLDPEDLVALTTSFTGVSVSHYLVHDKSVASCCDIKVNELNSRSK